jgi:hypothetical protein
VKYDDLGLWWGSSLEKGRVGDLLSLLGGEVAA